MMNIPAKPWRKQRQPKRILAIRLQAMGDLVITLPYVQALRNSLPNDVKIDLLTRKEVDPIPHSLDLFNKIYSIGGKRNFKKQFVFTCLLLPVLMLRGYDVVLDLQNNLLSRIVRKCIRPAAWSQFDKSSPRAAGERTRLTVESLGLSEIKACKKFSFKIHFPVADLLLQNGWDGESKLVIINPAGAFETRNWPLEYYECFMKLWLQKYPQTQFLMLGVELIQSKALYLNKVFDNKFINLVNKTNVAEAFYIMQQVHFVLSEDSGLMHFAWVSSVTTLAIFGSTRNDWATPLGENTMLLHSADLPCGNCFLAKCIYDDVHCLTRYTPEFVFEKAMQLLSVTE